MEFQADNQAWIIRTPEDNPTIIVNGDFVAALAARTLLYEEAVEKDSGHSWVVELNDWKIEAGILISERKVADVAQ